MPVSEWEIEVGILRLERDNSLTAVIIRERGRTRATQGMARPLHQ